MAKRTPNHNQNPLSTLPPILARGEEYVEPIEKRQPWHPSTFPRTYEQAREIVKTGLRSLQETLRTIPASHVLPQTVVCFRLHPDFDTKSSYPKDLIKFQGFSAVGSRRWARASHNADGLATWELAKLVFVRTSMAALDDFDHYLDIRESMLKDGFKMDIQKLETVDLLTPEETLIFPDGWNGGRIEIVMHPFDQLAGRASTKLLELVTRHGIPTDRVRTAAYVDGPTFWSVPATAALVKDLAYFNPLRTAHPLKMRALPMIRLNGSSAAPPAPSSDTKSTITIGMFDGGMDPNLPHLKRFAVDGGLSVTAPAESGGIEHGTAVAGALLYGPLADADPNVALPTPPVCVESFRALPVTPSDDEDLYEAINLVEKVVLSRPEIKVYNLSFGPDGPISNDHISRFTYSTDRLAYEKQLLFCTAVGNDGGLADPLCRIQAPADHVNNLAVGAFSYDASGAHVSAPYSCKGLGREGGKIKPDVVAFGGHQARPFGAVSLTPGQLNYIAGTSFASPLVARRIGELLGRSERLTPLLARALVIHTAVLPPGAKEYEMGHGVLANNVETTMGCMPGSVSVLYEGKVQPRKYAKLRIPLPDLPGFSGNIEIRWTIVVLARPDAWNTDEYTETSIEDTFHPHSQIYNVSKGTASKPLHLLHDATTISQLMAQDWKVSQFPATKSGNAYLDERARRADHKWDTVVRRKKSMRYSSLDDPFLVLHGLGRNDGDDTTSRMDYAVVVSITAKTYDGDLYAATLKQYDKLQPLRLRALNEIMVPTTP